MKARYLGDWRTVVREMLTQNSSWLPSATYDAGAAAGLRWNGKRWEHIGKKRKKEEYNPRDGEVFGAETETSNDIKREGEKHKAPD